MPERSSKSPGSRSGWTFSSDPRFVFRGCRECIIASLADANPGAPGNPVKRWFLAILPGMRPATRAAKFLRYRYALLTGPPDGTRPTVCIGCDYAAHQRKETPCPTTKNPPLESASTLSRLQSGQIAQRRASSIPSRSPAASRTRTASGETRLASTKTNSCLLRRRSIWHTRRYSGSGLSTVRISQEMSRPREASGQGALCALPFFSWAVLADSEQESKPVAIFLFLLPTFLLKAGSRSGSAFSRFEIGLFRRRNTKSFAMHLILGFIRDMIQAVKTDSKLCACATRHTQDTRLSALCLRSTWQGGGFPLRCILPRCRKRRAETLPVSTPSGSRRTIVFRPWEVLP